MTIKELEKRLQDRNSNLYIKQTRSYMSQLIIRKYTEVDYVTDKLEDNCPKYTYKDGRVLKILKSYEDKVLMGLPYPDIYPQSFPVYQEPMGYDEEGNMKYMKHRSLYNVFRELKAMQLI
jgi:hypothetical protein